MTLASEADARRWFADALGCDCGVFARLEHLVALLTEENALQNLVSARSLREVWVRHLADSAQLLSVSRGTPKTWLDLGSGAGFPGLVIAICRRDIDVTLVESRRRRVEWLQAASSDLGLENVTIAGHRLEKMPTRPAEVISARAFASLSQILSSSARFSTPQTQWLLPKGRSGAHELMSMPAPIRNMFHVEPSLTEPDAVILVGRGVPLGAALK